MNIFQVDVIELEPHVPGNLALGSHCDTIPFSGSGEKYDFPISIQVWCSIHLNMAQIILIAIPF